MPIVLLNPPTVQTNAWQVRAHNPDGSINYTFVLTLTDGHVIYVPQDRVPPNAVPANLAAALAGYENTGLASTPSPQPSWALRQAIVNANIKTQIETAVTNHPEVQSWWYTVSNIERMDPNWVIIYTAAVFTNQQMDSLFFAAGKLSLANPAGYHYPWWQQ